MAVFYLQKKIMKIRIILILIIVLFYSKLFAQEVFIKNYIHEVDTILFLSNFIKSGEKLSEILTTNSNNSLYLCNINQKNQNSILVYRIDFKTKKISQIVIPFFKRNKIGKENLVSFSIYKNKICFLFGTTIYLKTDFTNPHNKEFSIISLKNEFFKTIHFIS